MRLTPSLILQIQLILAQITYDQGQVSGILNYYGPITFTGTITFSNTFLKIPQIIIQPYDLRFFESINEANFEITSVALTNFQYAVNFPTVGSSGRYLFNWLAINEDRIQVINPPKETIVTNGIIYTFSHTLQQATQAVIMFNGFGFVQGDIDFELSVFSISSTNVKIQLLTTNTNIQALSYQIILGTKDAFYATNVQKTGSGASILGQYTVKILQNSILFYPFIGLSIAGGQYKRIISSSTTISSNYQYTYRTEGGTQITSITCQSVQFFTQILFPYYAKKYFVTKQFVEFPTQQILVKFIEINQSFNSDTLTTFNLLSTQTQLNVQIEIALSSGKKVQGYFLKCNECGDNNKFIINQAYYYQGSFIKFRIQLLQYKNVASNLIFSIASNKILIQQVINQAVDIYDIILLEIINA